MKYVNKDNLYSNFLKPISKNETIKYIINSKEGTSFYNYGLTSFVLKQIISYINNPLEHIFNLSITSGIFPHMPYMYRSHFILVIKYIYVHFRSKFNE